MGKISGFENELIAFDELESRIVPGSLGSATPLESTAGFLD